MRLDRFSSPKYLVIKFPPIENPMQTNLVVGYRFKRSAIMPWKSDVLPANKKWLHELKKGDLKPSKVWTDLGLATGHIQTVSMDQHTFQFVNKGYRIERNYATLLCFEHKQKYFIFKFNAEALFTFYYCL